MFDMLFIAVSHPLSPYIFSLDDRCKQMDDGERILVKEKIDSKARYARGYCPLFENETMFMCFCVWFEPFTLLCLGAQRL